MKLRSLVLAAVLGLAVPGLARAQDNKPALTPEQQKAQQKDKDFKKASEDLEKELKGKKVDPMPWQGLLQYFAYQLGLEVKDSQDLVHKVLAKKGMTVADAQTGASEKQRTVSDPKTGKIDLKKFLAEYKKWIGEWKAPSPAPAEKPGAANGGR